MTTDERFGYSSLVTESLRLAWMQKSLWALGFLLGGSSVFEFSNRVNVDDLAGDELGIALLIILLMGAFVVGILFFVLNSVAEGGLVAAGERLATGRTTTLGDSWNTGTRHWLRMMVLALLMTAAVIPVTFVLIGVPVILGVAVHPAVGILTGLVTFAVWVAVFLFLVPWFSLARRHVVIADTGVGASIRHATRLIRRNPLRALGVSAVRFVFLLATAIPMMILGAVILAPIAALALASEVLAGFVGVLFALPILVVVGSYFNTAGSYFWTLSYLWMDREPVVAVESDVPDGESTIGPPELPIPRPPDVTDSER